MSAAIHSLIPRIMRQREERLRAVARERREVDAAERLHRVQRGLNDRSECACGCGDHIDVRGLTGIVPHVDGALFFVPGHH